MVAWHVAGCARTEAAGPIAAVGTARGARECLSTREAWERPRLLSGYRTMVAVTGERREWIHTGVDIDARLGTPVMTAGDGVVVDVVTTDKLGGFVVVHHPRQKRYTGYMHLRNVIVKKGDQVRRGAPLGQVGYFPASGGVSHLHWEVCVEACLGFLGITVDPKFDRTPCPETPACSDVLTLPIACGKRVEGRDAHPRAAGPRWPEAP